MLDIYDGAGGGDPSLSHISALYLHIPFCRAKCAYCDFDSKPLAGCSQDAAMDTYVEQLVQRINAFGERDALAGIKTVYIGGGTPSVLGERLLAVVDAVTAWCRPHEFTCEANPESFTPELARGLREAGVTRISLGVQSLNDDELRQLGRLHDSHGALAAVALAKSWGFDVSLDLMCGIPLQTGESWADTLRRAIGAHPDHVSVYPLTLEDGTPLARRAEEDPALEPDEDLQADCMEVARAALMHSGYAPYEVASYAKPGKEARHNIAYWTGESYLGLGRSAASMLRACEYCQLQDLFPSDTAELPADAARIRLVQSDDAAAVHEIETLTAREAAAEDLMLACRMTVGIPRERLQLAQLYVPKAALSRAVEQAQNLGLASWENHALAPTQRGWLEGNVLFELFWALS